MGRIWRWIRSWRMCRHLVWKERAMFPCPWCDPHE